ncbi:hypothetical protein [Microvirga lotononidis]|uniref:Uncharacterized protein n=1 Tax=Microvirga lotononidis TaxID=864069 RepID=I4YS38_9HYPH|nr:hypothetical protein [Microvirga lotononidis]EIM26780.1 hypothetical protein MicloDRAFT_00033300 [Microvirga lotononidis]WQO31686.1 hypothetical protein U0023_30420 [Microvirga lotononidis]
MTDILRIAVPLTAWLAAFSAVYGLQGLVCSPRWAEAGFDLAAGRAAMTAAWIAAAILQVAFLLALRSPRFASRSAFVRGVSLTLAVVALVATLWTLVPVVTTSACL